MTRYTLLLGTRASILMLTSGRDVETIWILPDHSDAWVETLLGALKGHPFYPLKIVVDSAQMDVRVETLPPVNPWARQQIIKRQRAHAFPKAQLEASSSFRDENGAWRALHAAIPEEVWSQRVFDTLQQVSNPIEPLSFLATEWFDLAGHVNGVPQKGWAFINVLGESFGLRQLLLRDGKLMFTRSHTTCVPSLPKDELADRIASHIQSTQDYLPRMDVSLVGNVVPCLIVDEGLIGLVEHPDLAALQPRLVVQSIEQAENIPSQWVADIMWLYRAALKKYPVMPVDIDWLKQRRHGRMKNRVVLWGLVLLGCVGLSAGVWMLDRWNSLPMLQPAQVPLLAMELATPVEPPSTPAPTLKLEAVIYNSPQDWVVWINGEKHDSGHTNDYLTVLEVSPQSVQVHWQNEKSELRTTLTLVPSSSQISNP